MALGFPTTGLVTNVTTHSINNRTWLWNGQAWQLRSSFVGYTGSRGFQGDIGYVGSKGESSYTYSDNPPPNPVVGDRWFNTYDGVELVWTADNDGIQWVEVSASGFIGKIGYTGSSGAYSAIGFTGSLGYVGSQGEIGYTGSSGAYAAIGFTGSKGFTGSSGVGFTGSKGIQGDKGYTGSIGPIGIGYTGSQGSVGRIIAAAIIFGG
jgi:collagen type VII alpha